MLLGANTKRKQDSKEKRRKEDAQARQRVSCGSCKIQCLWETLNKRVYTCSKTQTHYTLHDNKSTTTENKRKMKKCGVVG
jgi:acetyl-CoA carboxylase beta subunit